jgi:hypothetical protein
MAAGMLEHSIHQRLSRHRSAGEIFYCAYPTARKHAEAAFTEFAGLIVAMEGLAHG